MTTRNFQDYDRVTEVLFPFSGLSVVDVEVLKKAADRGTKVHEICDALINNIGISSYDDSLQGYVESFFKWLPRKFLEKPKRFFCDDLMITGECDAIYEDNDGLVLVDFKTSLNEGKTWPLQGSAYSYLAKKEGYDIKKIEFVKISKFGKEPISYVYQENFDLFLKCLDVYRNFFDKSKKQKEIEFMKKGNHEFHDSLV